MAGELEEVKDNLVLYLRTLADEVESGTVKPKGFTQGKDWIRVEDGKKDLFIPTGTHQFLLMYEKL
jgi:hypothetical protein